MRAGWISLVLAFALILGGGAARAEEVRIKDLGRFMGWRENAVVGYGVVTGLAGSGDSPRSEATRQALKNVLQRLGVTIAPDQLQSRNIALVIVTATLPPSSNIGDRIDVTVTSAGDARSLAGGTLLMTPLQGPNEKVYGLAQGPLVVGGYRFDSNQNLQQKNYPTSGLITGGATVEAPVTSQLLDPAGRLTFVLKDPDFTTAQRVADGINAALGMGTAVVRGADAVVIDPAMAGGDVYRLLARIETGSVSPDSLARVVINERTGTVVAGAGVRISSVVISQGDIRVSVTTDNLASQPEIYGVAGPDVRSLVVTNTKLEVSPQREDAVAQFPNTTVGDLVQGLHRLHVDTRGTISILQALKAAGALHADIIIQ
jgi:flagellar P-ring protein precursor FlgI